MRPENREQNRGRGESFKKLTGGGQERGDGNELRVGIDRGRENRVPRNWNKKKEKKTRSDAWQKTE